MALKQQLDQVQDYADTVDIENEQQITTMANQLEDLSLALEHKGRDMNAMARELEEKVSKKMIENLQIQHLSTL